MSDQRPTIAWSDLDRQDGDARQAMAEIAAFRQVARPDRDAAFRVMMEQIRITLAQICQHPRVRGDLQAQILLADFARQPDLESLNLMLDRLAALVRPAEAPARPARAGETTGPLPRPAAPPRAAALAPAADPAPRSAPTPQAPRRRLWV